jgi:hypothetical protein
MQSAFRFELKQLQESGEFVGLAATYSLEPDLVQDRILPGSFTKNVGGQQRKTVAL